MDSLLSGGKRRVRALSSGDMRIQLPCDTDVFHFGEAVRMEFWDNTIIPKGNAPIGQMGIVAQCMRVADIWGKVARWACSDRLEGRVPWEHYSPFEQLHRNIATWRDQLPKRLRLGIANLHAHSASNQGQAYAYMHAIGLMALMFLHRAYLPQPHSRNSIPKQDIQSPQWREWQAKSRRELMRITEQACDMFEDMRDFGLYFLRGLVPWIGYTVYTAAGIMLYFYHFPNEDDGEDVLERCRDRVVNGCDFLKDMKNSWPMADSWVSRLLFIRRLG